jgi:hypothetical protein
LTPFSDAERVCRRGQREPFEKLQPQITQQIVLPEAVVTGTEPLMIIGAMAGARRRVQDPAGGRIERLAW